MKIVVFIFAIPVFLSLISCKETRSKETINSRIKEFFFLDSLKNAKKISDSTALAKSKKYNYIIFGVFCGECNDLECATMYKLDVSNNKLLVDHTDSYWEYAYHGGKSINFSTNIQDKLKISLAKQIIDSIPDIVGSTTNDEVRKFGCSGSKDGCRIFLETQKDTIVKKFYIDYKTEQLTGEVKQFAEYLKKTIQKIETNN